MYGQVEPALADAYRVTARAVKRGQGIDNYIDNRISDLIWLMANHPLSVRTEHMVPSYYGRSTGLVSVAEDLMGWVVDHALDVERTAAEIAFDTAERARIVRRWAEKRAEDEANRMDDEQIMEYA
jgi:hypothetical protein